MSQLTLREAHYSDLPRVAEILTRAFWNDGMFGDTIHPHRKAHPEGMELYWLRRARVNFWDYTWKFLVGVMPDGQEGGEKIVGIAQWARLGEGGRRMRCWWFDPRECSLSTHLGDPGVAFTKRARSRRLLSADHFHTRKSLETSLQHRDEGPRPHLPEPRLRPSQGEPHRARRAVPRERLDR